MSLNINIDLLSKFNIPFILLQLIVFFCKTVKELRTLITIIYGCLYTARFRLNLLLILNWNLLIKNSIILLVRLKMSIFLFFGGCFLLFLFSKILSRLLIIRILILIVILVLVFWVGLPLSLMFFLAHIFFNITLNHFLNTFITQVRI